MGLIYGVYDGRGDGLQPASLNIGTDPTRLTFSAGGASYETGFCPHGGMLSFKNHLWINFRLLICHNSLL